MCTQQQTSQYNIIGGQNRIMLENQYNHSISTKYKLHFNYVSVNNNKHSRLNKEYINISNNVASGYGSKTSHT